MVPIVVLATLLVAMLLRLFVDLASVSGKWRHILNQKGSIASAFSKVLETVSNQKPESNRQSADRVFWEWKKTWVSDFKRRARMIKILAGAAPLLGLLGTVTGMLKTFQGLSLKSGMNSMNTVADGISEALVTTQTGLSFGILAIVLLYFIDNYAKRLSERLEIIDARYVLEMNREGVKG